MVAIVIVAVLATIGAVTARSVQARAGEARCMSNLRQIGVALHIYAGDHSGNFPETSHTADLDNAWIMALEPYLGDYDESRICPGDPRGAERLAAGGTSYVLNSFLFVPEIGPWGEIEGRPMNRPSAIPRPAQTLFAFTCADRIGVGPGNDHTHSKQWNSWSAICADIAPGRFGGEDDPHGVAGRTNYLYVDGHVESITAAKVKSKVDSGINIAKPPGI
jgi:prepilin-type processing-associated H-X9-DG protein